MGFVSKLALTSGKIGKTGGKAFLTYAPALIPGVGPFASAAISAGLNAAEAKAKGGSVKDALIAGGIGAGTSYLGGKIPGIGGATKGIGPSSAVTGGGVKAGLSNVLKGAAGGAGVPGVAGKGWQGKLGNIIGNEVMSRVGSRGSSGSSGSGRSSGSQYQTPDFNPASEAQRRPAPGTGGGSMPRGGFKYDENPLNQYDQTTPNLAMALHQGRQEAIRNQPFRSGYQTNTLGTDKETMFTSQMPKLYSGFGSGQKKRRNTTQDQEASR